MAAQDRHHPLEGFSLPWHLLRNCIKSSSNQLISTIEDLASESFSDEDETVAYRIEQKTGCWIQKTTTGCNVP
jgi:hypothetical protein